MGLICLKVLCVISPSSFYVVVWREFAQIAINKTPPFSLDEAVRPKVLKVLSHRKPHRYWIDGGEHYRYAEPFCRFLARIANKDELDWALDQGVNFGVRTSSGSSFLSDALDASNTDALQWAKTKNFNFNLLSRHQMPLMAYLMISKTPFHPYVELFLEAGASLDFKGHLGLTGRQVLEQNPDWYARWQKNMIRDALGQHLENTTSSHRSKHKM